MWNQGGPTADVLTTAGQDDLSSQQFTGTLLFHEPVSPPPYLDMEVVSLTVIFDMKEQSEGARLTKVVPLPPFATSPQWWSVSDAGEVIQDKLGGPLWVSIHQDRTDTGRWGRVAADGVSGLLSRSELHECVTWYTCTLCIYCKDPMYVIKYVPQSVCSHGPIMYKACIRIYSLRVGRVHVCYKICIQLVFLTCL